jgi:FkbM family methyltransferase
MRQERNISDLLELPRFIVCGANSGGDQVHDWLREQGKEVLAFVDTNETLQGSKRRGLPVLPPADAVRRGDVGTGFAIGTIRQREIAELLTLDFAVPAARVFPFINPMFATHFGAGALDNFLGARGTVRAALADSDSRDYFDRVSNFYRTMNPSLLWPNPSCRSHYGYAAEHANPQPGIVIVDCGAFTGDTLPFFLEATGRSCHVYAIEAFASNHRRLKETIAALGAEELVTPVHVAVGAAKGEVSIAGDTSYADGGAGLASFGRQDCERVRCETLDSLFLDGAKGPIGYIKIDVEGADLDVLKGGERLLREMRPVVAVAAYHTPDHLWEIPQYLLDTLGPCRLYAGHDPAWLFHLHFIAVPDRP